MPVLKLQLFGSPALIYGEQVLEGVRRKSLALAAYLCMTERPPTREAVAALLWGEQDGEHSRSSLRSTLYNLSNAAPVEWIDADRSTLTINFAAIEVDAYAFLADLQRTRAHLHTDGMLCDSCYSALAEAVKLYNKDFLDGFHLPDCAEFEQWQTLQREHMKRECARALRRLAEHAQMQSSASLSDAITFVRRWLQISPLEESAYRLLMRLLAANGQRTEALKQYQDCARLFDEELATLPEPETIALYEAIRDGEPVFSAAPQSYNRESARVTSVLPPLPALVVGREDALAELRSRLGVVQPETRRPTTIIEGWPGVGKSTMIGALAHDPALNAAFPDGVLWTSLGEAPALPQKLMVWGEALHVIPPGKSPPLETLTSKLTAALRDRQMLLIVDDVWQVEHAAPFQVGGQGCAMLMGSRLSSIARALAPTSADVYRLPVLTDEYALSLLSHLAPGTVDSHPEESLQLIHDLEGLPLALQVAGRLLHEEMNMGWGVVELLQELRSGANLLNAQAPNDMQQGYTAPTVMALLKRSTDTLKADVLHHFAMLSMFAAKPSTFDLAAMAAVWGVPDAKPTVRQLVNRGLLEPIRGGRFQMHALLMLHAQQIMAELAG